MNPPKREPIRETIVARNKQDTFDQLIADLGNRSEKVRRDAHDLLLAKGETALMPLVKALSNPNGKVRWEAGKLLDEIGINWSKHADEETINALVEELCSKDGFARVKARLALVIIGGRTVQALSAALQSKNQTCRWEAAKALGQIGDPAAVKVLIKALEDEIFDVRWLAAEGIISIGLPALEPILQEISKRGDSLWLREGVHRILHGIFSEDIAAIVKPVLKALEETEAPLKVPFAAENALKHLKIGAAE